jgi:hypothetical protein
MEKICQIDIKNVDYQSGIERRPIDTFEFAAYILSEMRVSQSIPLLAVTFDKPSMKYLIVCDGRAYTQEGFALEGARKLGLSTVPCRIVGDRSSATDVPIQPQPSRASMPHDYGVLSKK